ncbi:MAG: hypothetical protein WAW37_14140 [Syntrophobacteraceae bacterium]
MLEFPTLTDEPDVDSWEEQKAFDPTIRARSEGGYTKTRPRTTWIPTQWKFRYAYLSAADKAALQAFENNVRVGADAFSWTCPADGQVKTVRFKEAIKFTPAGSKLNWKADLAIEEAGPAVPAFAYAWTDSGGFIWKDSNGFNWR